LFINQLEASIKRHRNAIQFCLIFSASIALFAAVLLKENTTVNAFLKALVARATGLILGLFTDDVQVLGTTVQSGGTAFQIITACTGVFTMAIFLSAVLAYPCRMKAKLIGIAIGLPAIFSVNLVRVISLFYISLYRPEFFPKAHLLIWQSLIIFSAIVIYIFWLGRFAHAEAEVQVKIKAKAQAQTKTKTETKAKGEGSRR